MAIRKLHYLHPERKSVMLSTGKEAGVGVSKPIAATEMMRVGKFGIVGVLNTLIDFILYNLLSSKIGLTLVQSNIISTTVAMMFSFMANKNLVFKKTNGSVAVQAAVFFATTAFGLYVLQSGTIILLTDIWLWPVHTLVGLAHLLTVTGHDEFIIKNGAKAAATLVSLTWNYIMYKKVVFR
jgi:putative flippase GtrA